MFNNGYKLMNRIPGSRLLIYIKFTRLSFENACWIARQASRCQHAFSKPCLVNLISKDTHLVFSITYPKTVAIPEVCHCMDILLAGIFTVQKNNYSDCKICKSYTMGCPPVRGDNPRALASGLSYVQVDKHGTTILYHLHQWRPCTSQDISC